MSRRRMRKPKRIKLRSNEFWGLRSGFITKMGERIFKIKKWAMGKQNSYTPKRGERTYKNPKLGRLSLRVAPRYMGITR